MMNRLMPGALLLGLITLGASACGNDNQPAGRMPPADAGAGTSSTTSPPMADTSSSMPMDGTGTTPMDSGSETGMGSTMGTTSTPGATGAGAGGNP